MNIGSGQFDELSVSWYVSVGTGICITIFVQAESSFFGARGKPRGSGDGELEKTPSETRVFYRGTGGQVLLAID